MSTVAGVSLSDIDLTDLDRWSRRGATRLVRAAAPRGAGLLAGRARRPRLLVADALRRHPRGVQGLRRRSPPRLGGTSLMDLTPEQVQSRMSMLDSDPPKHRRLRNIVNKAFTVRVVNAYEDRIRAMFREVPRQRVRRARARLRRRGGGRAADADPVRADGRPARGPASPRRPRQPDARQHRPRPRGRVHGR